MRNPNSQDSPNTQITVRLNEPFSDRSLAAITQALDQLLGLMIRVRRVVVEGESSGFTYRVEKVGNEISFLVFDRPRSLVAYKNYVGNAPFAGADLTYIVATHAPRGLLSPALRDRLAALGVGRGIVLQRFSPHGRHEIVREMDARLALRIAQLAAAHIARLLQDAA